MDYTYLALHTNTFVGPHSASHSLSNTHSHYWAAAALQDTGKPIGSNLGSSVLPEDIWIYGQLEPGSELQTLWFSDDPIYQLSQNYPI